MVPVMLTALLFGVRGGLLGAVVGVLAISTFHAIVVLRHLHDCCTAVRRLT